MRTKEYINETIKEMKLRDTSFKSKLGTKKEVIELERILYDDERLSYICSGTYEGGTWLVTLTDRRIIFLDKGMLYGLKQKQIPLDKVNSVNYKRGMVFAKLFIEDGSGKTLVIGQIIKDDASEFVRIMDENILECKQMLMAGTSRQRTDDDIDSLIKLRELASLNNEGIISDDEFEKVKKKILKALK